jgi:carbon monoxide dehydrogenase subunit G
MRIDERFTLEAPLETAFAFLADVRRVAGCVPGVEGLTEQEDGSFTAQLKVQLGPIKASFDGEVALVTDRDARRLTATGQGRDKGSGSRAEVAFAGDLEERDDGSTDVVSVAEVTIRGKLGQFGTGVIRATATEVLRDFVACANATLRADAAAAAAGEHGPGDGVAGGAAPRAALTPAPTVGLGLALRIGRSWLRSLLPGRR